MKTIILIILAFLSGSAYGQTTEGTIENRDLVFDSNDLKIIQRADSILSDTSKWSKQDDRECEDDIANGVYSLFGALYKASVDITGEYTSKISYANSKIYFSKV